MQLDDLAFYKRVLPCLKGRAGRRAVDDLGIERWEDYEIGMILESALDADIYDCRSLNREFIYDTGDAAFEEGKALLHEVRLPSNSCYFEFADERAVLAEARINSSAEAPALEIESVAAYPLFDWSNVSFAERIGASEVEFPNGSDVAIWNADGPEFCTCPRQHEAEEAAKLLLGALTLLSEHLVATAVEPDPTPEKSAARKRRGHLPISGERRVLTINTAAVRRASRRPVGSHESPRLHWRRGHWRTLFRGSEFEDRTWVRRCLVGDPDAGYVHKDYRLVWQQPMLVPTAA